MLSLSFLLTARIVVGLDGALCWSPNFFKDFSVIKVFSSKINIFDSLLVS